MKQVRGEVKELPNDTIKATRRDEARDENTREVFWCTDIAWTWAPSSQRGVDHLSDLDRGSPLRPLRITNHKIVAARPDTAHH